MSLWLSIIKKVLTVIRNAYACDTKERIKRRRLYGWFYYHLNLFKCLKLRQDGWYLCCCIHNWLLIRLVRYCQPMVFTSIIVSISFLMAFVMAVVEVISVKSQTHFNRYGVFVCIQPTSQTKMLLFYK